MTHISPKDFMSDDENLMLIKKVIVHQRYCNSFKFLYNFFFVHKQNYITRKFFQTSVGVMYPQEANQILSSFCQLHLLTSKKFTGLRDFKYFLANPEWWQHFANDAGCGEEKKEGGDARGPDKTKD